MATPKKPRGKNIRVKTKATKRAAASARTARTPRTRTKRRPRNISPPVAQITHSAHLVETKPDIVTAEVTRQTIEEAAYFLWLERGGDATSNWVEAERKLALQTAS